MIAVIQRVSSASVSIRGKIRSQIDQGLLALLGIESADAQEDVDWLAKKIINLRIFDDPAGVMNKNILTVGGGLLVVSQFTLHAATKKGNRPSYMKVARPEIARPLYESFILTIQSYLDARVRTGEFGEYMKVSAINDGPGYHPYRHEK